jgi:hypothetical protein
MGERDVARIDPSALREMARRYQSVSDSLVGGVAPLLRWSFGADRAGRDHGARGQALRLELEASCEQIGKWSRSAAETAVALQVTVDRYLVADAAVAARIR